MTEDLADPKITDVKAKPKVLASDVVIRSTPPAKTDYREYRNDVRRDFFYSCAYCTMSELEAQAVHFCIDHYRPQDLSPELAAVYDNLLYCCNDCNTRKGARFPTDEAFKNGQRYFRPDIDSRSEHFLPNGQYVEALTSEADFSILTLDLNRLTVRRIRDLRKRIANCSDFIAHGVLGLKKFPIDLLPANIRAQALRTINDAALSSEALHEKFDDFLRSVAKSQVLGDDDALDDLQHNKERRQGLKDLNVIFPNLWEKKAT